MPEEGIKLLPHKDILSFDEIRDFTREAVGLGITKVRITGGEPLVRRGIVTLVGMLSALEGIKDLSMTTNGVLLGHYAGELRQAGLQRVNISLDTVDPERFRAITRTGNIGDVFAGINAAREAGLHPIKINCVIGHTGDGSEANAVASFCKENDLEIRFITQMDLEKGHFSTVVGGTGGNCPLCNRLRLTSSGKLKPCLFSNIEFDVRQLGYKKALALAAGAKPECGSTNDTGAFYNIGG